ncbi:MAG: hypothetical protein NTV03_01035 [Candidatus Nomurabacteria bacterium]|nr:hypothetical protein [Candidatus Nomurabacteria bacterium]
MGNFQGGGNRGGGFRGGNGGGGRPSFGGGRGGDRGPVTMHKAVCDECHKNCEVPFRPSGDKPIYCSDCFSSKREDNGDRAPRREFSNDRAPRREFNDRPAPSFSKPAAPANDDVKRQLSEMNSKLDRLINSIEKLAQPKASVAQVVAKPVVKVAPVVVKAPIKKVVAVKAPAKKVVAKKGKK